MTESSNSNSFKFVSNEKLTKFDSETQSNDKHNTKSSKRIFTSWKVPFERRRQTFAHVVVLLIPYILHFFSFLCIMIPLFWPFYLTYLTFIYFDTAPENGSRPVSWWRNSVLWKWYADYFPTKIVNEADLDPNRKYIFGYHPHGIVSLGCLTNFGTNATGIEQIFPNINIRPLTLDLQFKFPFYRDYLLSLGLASASKKSIRNILAKGPGNACLLVIGGAEEALEAKPDRANLKLAKRCGFIKMALENGADLVPVFAFGENQLYDQVDNTPGTWIYSIQQLIKKATTFPAPICHGRGVFNYVFGALPYRLPNTVVTCAPIKVEQCNNPTDEQIHKLHQQYKDALLDLYNRNKGTYWVGSNPPELKFY